MADVIETSEVKNPRLQGYLEAITSYEREFKKWEGRSDKIIKRYRDERPENRSGQTKFNVLWSNVQTLVPACFSRLPQPDVTRRFRDNDPVGRVSALILERALEYHVSHYTDYREAMRAAVRARFLGGRGQAWARYEPHFKQSGDTGQISEEEDDVNVEEQLDYECVSIDYVNTKDFGHNVARTWNEVYLVWRKVYLNKRGVTKRFGKEIANKLSYDSSPTDEIRKSAKDTPKKQACIYELCDKDEGVFVWLSKSYPDFLDEREDPMQLEGFFPCPKPLYATMTEDSLVPIPDFTLYQDQANSLDTLADRIYGLCEMLQVKGAYDGSVPELARIFTEGRNGTLIGVKNWAAFAEKNGLQGSLNIVDLKPIAEALQIAVEAFAQKKAEMDELSGVIDVIRGQVDPNEKLGQTEMKGQFANLRLRDKQQDVAEFATSILQLMAQVICTKFQPQTIAAMAAVEQLTPEDKEHVPAAMALLVGEERLQDPEAEAPNPLRSFRISIAADTLVEVDEQAEKRDRMEMLTAFGGYLKQAAEVAMMAPALVPLVIEVGKFGIQAFKVGKGIEGTFDTALDQIKKMVQQQQANPQPDPAVEAEKAKAEVAKEKGAIDIQVAREKAAIEREKLQGKQQMQQQQMALDQQQAQQDMAIQQQQGVMKQQQSQAKHQQKMQQAQQRPVGRR